jgi:hypothetical protein
MKEKTEDIFEMIDSFKEWAKAMTTPKGYQDAYFAGYKKGNSIRKGINQKNKGKIIYISGAMTGIPDLNFPAFYAAEGLLTAMGHITVNPAEIGKGLIIPEGLTKREIYLIYIHADLEAMLIRGCNTIYMLKGWERSGGAKVEFDLAIVLGFEIMYEGRG